MSEDWDKQLAICRVTKDHVSFRGYVASRGRHDLNHIEQIRAALTG